jgi:predicted lactoylglutathione lyase
MAKQIYVNLPVKDLKSSMSFFSVLGFEFNKQFTNDQGACMIIGENIFAMLLVEPFFKGFTDKPIADAKKTTEVINCLSCESRSEVDAMVTKAKKAGGLVPRAPQDHGFMYQHGFEDLDGHIWEVAYMDMAAMAKQAP